MQIDFSAAFYWVNHQRILYKLCSVGIGGSVLCVLAQLLSNRPRRVMVDGCFESTRLRCVMDAAGKCFGSIIFLTVTSRNFFHSGK